MANITSNSLFIVSALVFVVGLLFLAFPYLTLLALTLCAIGYSCYTHRSDLLRYYSNWSATYWPPVNVSDRAVPYTSSLLSGVDLPSPIPHIPSGIETFKNRRSPVNEIVSSTPRCSPTSSHGSGSSLPMQMQMRPSAEMVTSDSRQLNFGRITTPKTSRLQAQDGYQNNVDASSNQRLRNRSDSNKVIQTTAGPLLATSHYSPSFDAGIFVNVNSPGFTDRLVRCASDNTGINWGHGGLATRQDKYGSVGLFPIVHLNAPTTPALSARNSQKAPNSNVRVRIAAPAYSEPRQHPSRGCNMQMRSYVPARESLRRNEVAKSVLESLQEASRKRIYSQCQEVMEEDSGKKRQRKGESALPNPNCDIYQYRHIRAPSIPSMSAANAPNEIHPQSKRVHEDPSPKANEPKRQRQHGRPQSTNNEISSSLSSSKTLLQRLSGSKRKADYECSEGGSEKHFKDACNAVSVPSTSRWLYSRPCDEGESAARTQEVVRSQKKSASESPSASKNSVLKRNNVETENSDHSGSLNSASTVNSQKAHTESHDKLDTDLASKLFRKDTVSRSHPKVCQPEKKGSSWAQEPPDADERCLLEQSNSSDIDRPERFQSLLSRMCGQDVLSVKPSEILSESFNSVNAQTASPDLQKTDTNKITTPASSAAPSISNHAVSLSAAPTPLSNSTSLAVSNPELTKSLSAASVVQISVSPTTVQASYLSSAFSTSAPSSQVANPSFTTLPFRVSPSQETEVRTPSEQDKTDGPTSLALTAPSVSLSSPPAKPMFNFNSPTSLPPPRSTIPQTLSLTSAASSSSTNPPPFVSSMFNFASSPVKPSTGLAEYQAPTATESSPVPLKPLTAPPLTAAPAPAQKSGFSFLSANTPSTVGLFSTDIGKSSTTSAGTVKFSLPSEKHEFSTGSGTFMTSQEPQANGQIITAPDLMTSNVPAISANQTGTLVASDNVSHKSSFGGFQFSGSSGSIFGQSAPNGIASTPPFSFAPTATSAASATSEKSTLDPKFVSGSGSITFGTVSTAVVSQSTNSGAFSFSSPPARENTSGSDTQKSPFQLNAFGATTTNNDSASSGFRNPSQGLFNGIANSTTSVAPSFGSSPQQIQQQYQQQNQQHGAGMFSFGSAQSQQQPSVTFSGQPPASTSVFGEGASQQQNFGATTTAGFPPQSTMPSFRSSPFVSSAPTASLSSLPFGPSQPSNAIPCGGQAVPAFGLPSSNPPSFSNSSVSTVTPSFGGAFPPSFAVSADPSFGSNAPSVQVAPVTSAFNFGASTGKLVAPGFNFGANSAAVAPTSAPAPTPAPTFGFGSGEQQQQSSGIAPFQFGHTANPAAAGASASAFQFRSPSAQPGGSGGFSMGSGPSTPQRSRSLQTRRKRIQ